VQIVRLQICWQKNTLDRKDNRRIYDNPGAYAQALAHDYHFKRDLVWFEELPPFLRLEILNHFCMSIKAWIERDFITHCDPQTGQIYVKVWRPVKPSLFPRKKNYVEAWLLYGDKTPAQYENYFHEVFEQSAESPSIKGEDRVKLYYDMKKYYMGEDKTEDDLASSVLSPRNRSDSESSSSSGYSEAKEDQLGRSVRFNLVEEKMNKIYNDPIDMLDDSIGDGHATFVIKGIDDGSRMSTWFNKVKAIPYVGDRVTYLCCMAVLIFVFISLYYNLTNLRDFYHFVINKIDRLISGVLVEKQEPEIIEVSLPEKVDEVSKGKHDKAREQKVARQTGADSAGKSGYKKERVLDLPKVMQEKKVEYEEEQIIPRVKNWVFYEDPIKLLSQQIGLPMFNPKSPKKDVEIVKTREDFLRMKDKGWMIKPTLLPKENQFGTMKADDILAQDPNFRKLSEKIRNLLTARKYDPTYVPAPDFCFTPNDCQMWSLANQRFAVEEVPNSVKAVIPILQTHCEVRGKAWTWKNSNESLKTILKKDDSFNESNISTKVGGVCPAELNTGNCKNQYCCPFEHKDQQKVDENLDFFGFDEGEFVEHEELSECVKHDEALLVNQPIPIVETRNIFWIEHQDNPGNVWGNAWFGVHDFITAKHVYDQALPDVMNLRFVDSYTGIRHFITRWIPINHSDKSRICDLIRFEISRDEMVKYKQFSVGLSPCPSVGSKLVQVAISHEKKSPFSRECELKDADPSGTGYVNVSTVGGYSGCYYSYNGRAIGTHKGSATKTTNEFCWFDTETIQLLNLQVKSKNF